MYIYNLINLSIRNTEYDIRNTLYEIRDTKYEICIYIFIYIYIYIYRKRDMFLYNNRQNIVSSFYTSEEEDFL